MKPREPYDVVRWLLAALLLAAAALKGHELATSEVAGASPWTSRPFLLGLVLFELAFGLWLLTGLYPNWTRLATLAFFFCLLEVSLYRATAGEQTCGCFGRVELSPWGSAGVAGLALVALVSFGPRQGSAPSAATVRWRLTFFSILFPSLAVPAAITMVNYTTGGITPSLRTDSRLQTRLTLDLKNPCTDDILQQLRHATALNLTLDPRLEKQSPDYGRVLLRRVDAWAVMEMVAQKQPLPARWVEAEGGYHLASVAPLGNRLTPWLVSAGLFVPLSLGAALLLVRSRNGVRTPPPAEPARAV